jgi:nickel transport protein
MQPRNLLPLVVAVACLALPAAAHETTVEVTRDRAVAVRARTHDGDGVGNAEAEVFSPTDPVTPFWKGRTDRSGWVAFVPDAPGRWRVQVVDPTGHGAVATVDVPAPGAAGPGSASPPPASAGASLARPLVGVTLVAAIFGLLFAWGRRKGP